MTSGAAPFDLVIFDLDGTLVDSLPDIAAALNATLAHAGMPALAVEAIGGFVGDGAAKLIERAFPASVSDPRQHASLLALFMASYSDSVCVDSRVYPGVAELLASLGGCGTKTAVLSNKPGPLARSLLQGLSLAKYFAAIIGDGDGYPRKPDTTAAHALIKDSGTSAARTVVVGDGLPDMRMSHAIPCAAIAAGWGYVPLTRLKAESPTFAAASVKDATQILLPAGLAPAPTSVDDRP